MHPKDLLNIIEKLIDRDSEEGFLTYMEFLAIQEILKKLKND